MKQNKDTNSKPQKPIPLVRKVRYPTYQLWAIAGDGKDKEAVLRIAVLHTMQWLCERFLEYGYIEELDYPLASDYEKVALSDFANVSIKEGYELEVIWLMEEKSWSLRLTESDPGIAPREGNQGRQPIPGRRFETNISYQISNNGVLCGFQTMVTEPEGTLEHCEVFRLGVIKHLKRDPLVGLRQIWILEEKPYYLQTLKDVKGFFRKLKQADRTMPVVIVSEYLKPAKKPKARKKEIKPLPENPLELLNLDDDKLWSKQYSLMLDSNNANRDDAMPDTEPVLPIDIDIISYNRMGYAHFFIVPAKVRNDFNKHTKLSLCNGGMIFYPSPQTDEDVSSYSYEDITAEGFMKKLEDMTQQYSCEKRFDFSHCCFVEKSHEIHSERLLKDIGSLSEMKDYYADEIARIKDNCDKVLAEAESDRRLENRKLERKLAKGESRRNELENKLASLHDKIQRYKAEVESYENRLMAQRARPAKPSEVCDWVVDNFGDRIVILESVRKVMKDIKRSEVDMMMLCDSLEYMANEYWEHRNGLIDEYEKNRRCSRNYNRPFQVVPDSEASRGYYPNDYTVTYEKKGANLDEQLRMHLKVGTTLEKLVRIYFFIDKEDGRIVIGSMPKHLKIISQR